MMKLKVIAITAMCLAVAAPGIGQGRRGSFGTPTPLPGVSDRGERPGDFPGAGDRNPLDRLEGALDLSPSQVASLEVLVEQRQTAQEGFRQPMELAREAFQAAVDSGDPTAIGNAFLAQRELSEQLRAINEEFMAAFRSLLTLEQQEKLDSIEAFSRGSSGRGDGSGRSGRPQGRRDGDFPRPRGGR